MRLELLRLQAMVRKGEILNAQTFEDSAVHDVLDKRESEPFDSAWVTANDAVDTGSIAPESKSIIDAIREMAYKTTFTLTENPDLAAYVSDDFGLIGAAIEAKVDDPWINALFLEYRSGRVPAGDLSPFQGSLGGLIGLSS